MQRIQDLPGKDFALELIPIYGTYRIAKRVEDWNPFMLEKDGGGYLSWVAWDKERFFTPANLITLGGVGVSGAFDVVTVLTIGRCAGLAGVA